MLPICYEESLPNGNAPSCAEFMATATEQFIKEVVGGVLARTRSNIVTGGAGGNTIMTVKYRRQLIREEGMLEKGVLGRGGVNNLLPIEAKEAAGRRALAVSDFRVALGVGDCALGQMPDVVSGIVGGWAEGVLEGWDTYPAQNGVNNVDGEGDGDGPRAIARDAGTKGAKANGIAGVHYNGLGTKDDNDAYGWEGGSAHDRSQLNGLLDQCLAVGR